jgi:hypothetical protein
MQWSTAGRSIALSFPQQLDKLDQLHLHEYSAVGFGPPIFDGAQHAFQIADPTPCCA